MVDYTFIKEFIPKFKNPNPLPTNICRKGTAFTLMPSFPFLKSFAARVVVVALARYMRCHFRVCMTCHGCFYERVVGSLQEKKSSLLLYISQDGDLHNAGDSTCHNWFYPKAQACKSQVWLLLWPWSNCKKRRSDCYISWWYITYVKYITYITYMWNEETFLRPNQFYPTFW